MERDCESELSKLNIEQNACIYHFGASVIHGQRSNILRLPYNTTQSKNDGDFSKCQKWVQKNRKPFLNFLFQCAALYIRLLFNFELATILQP